MDKEYTVRTALLSDQKQIGSFLNRAGAMHRHLDWRSPLDWLGYDQFLILEESSKIKALLICTAEPGEVFWMRVFASWNFASLQDIPGLLPDMFKTFMINFVDSIDIRFRHRPN